LSRSAGTSGRNGRANLWLEKCVIYPRVSSTASPTMSGHGRHRFPVGSARTWLQRQCSPRDAGAINHRGAVYPGRAQESPGGRRGPTGRKLRLPKVGVPLRTSRCDFPIHAEASVHTGRTRNTAPAAPGRLGHEHHHRNRRAHLDERVRRGYHPKRGGRYDSGEDRSPSPEPLGPQAFSRAIRRVSFPTRFRTPTTIAKYSGETRPELWLAYYQLAYQLGGTDDDNLIIRNLPLFLSDTARAWLEHLPPGQITNWDDLVQAFAGNFQARMCALETPGISEAAASSRESLSGTTSDDSRSSAPSCPTSPIQMSSARSSPAPPAATW
jgi:hypothetical protein